MHLCRSSSNVPCLPSFLEMLQNPHVLVTFDKVHNPLRLPRETTSEPPNSKSGANIWCFAHFDFEMCFPPQRRALFLKSTSKSGPSMVCFVHFDFTKCASRHNGVHFFDIATPKSGPELVCFVHFDLEMCFAPQRRALFRHLN